MPSLARLAEQEQRPARDDLASMTNEGLNDLLEIENLWLSVNQSHHVNANNRLQLRLCVQVVENNIANFASAQLNNNPQTIFVGLIPKLGNALNFLLFDELGNSLEQTCLIQLVRDLMNDDRVLALGLISHHLCFCSDVDTSSTSAVCLNNPCSASDNGSRREIRPGNVTN